MMLERVLVGGLVVTTAYAGYRLVHFVKGRLLNRSFTNFANKYVQNATEAMCRSMSINEQLMTEIEQYLKHRGVCDHIEKTGSTYDGLSVVDDDDIQLEVLMIQPVSSIDIAPEKDSDMPGYSWLRYIHGRDSNPILDRVLSTWNILGALTGKRYLDAEKTVDLFHRELKNCIVDSKQMSGRVKLIRKGLGLQMEVYPDSWLLSWGSRLYRVDLVPAFKMGEELYESRPEEGDEAAANTMTWHRSFALQERQMLCEGAKLVLRVLRVLQKREFDFGNFTFYQLKTVVLYETDTNPDWSEPMLGSRLSDVLKRLEKCLAARNLPHYFSPEINLLSKMPLFTMDYLRDRIRRLRANESEMRKLLER